MQALFGGLFLFLALIIHFYLPQLKNNPSPVQAEQVAPAEENIQPIKTESRFQEKLSEIAEVIPKKTVYKNDPEIEAGKDTVLEEGSDGKKVQIIKTVYYDGEKYGQEVVGTEVTPPEDRVISRGTKIIWKTLDTPEGEIRYWKEMRVWATHYDGGAGCMGCSGRGITATGLKAGKGVIAVDPSVIKLGSEVYIPGYGRAVAGDTGGRIIGPIIDLGFEDARTAGWSARFVDIYILK